MTTKKTDTSMTVSEAGRKGGKSRSPAKLRAVRENGKRGGRPLGAHDNDTPARIRLAWSHWTHVSLIAKQAGLEVKVRELAPLSNANSRSIRIRTRRLEKIIAGRG